MQYTYIPENIKRIEEIYTAQGKIKVIADTKIPKGEIHLVNDSLQCVGKIIDICMDERIIFSQRIR